MKGYIEVYFHLNIGQYIGPLPCYKENSLFEQILGQKKKKQLLIYDSGGSLFAKVLMKIILF